jgi:hypothetical protein
MRPKASRRTIAAIAVALATLVVARPASAVNPRIEAAAKTAIDRAAQEFAGDKLDAAMTRLQKALAACGIDKCSKGTKAALMRDTAAIEFKRGNREAALNALVSAFAIDPTIEKNPKYDVPAMNGEWDPAKDEALATKGPQPGGDFTHTPAAEQTVNTPLPVYVEYTGSSKLTRVTLKYKGTGMSEFKLLALAKKKDGWAATIPCADVKRGGVRYYVEGFDTGGDIVARSGSPTQPFGVPIRTKISGSPPSLPGASAPKACSEGSSEPTPAGATGASCTESSECKSGKCTDGSCAEPEKKEEEPTGEFSRIWIGVAGSIDFVSLPAGTDVCHRTNNGVAVNGAYYCVNPDGTDFPGGVVENGTLQQGRSGQAPGGFTTGNARIMLSLDIAATVNILVGLRFGYVVNNYPGSDAITLGHGFRKPVHFEGRLTYVFGEAPLARAGLAPYIFVGGGAAAFSAQTPVNVAPQGATADQPKQAWITAGPGFFAGGGGVRYAFTPRAAGLLGLHVAGAPGPTGLMPFFSPELQLMYGF